MEWKVQISTYLAALFIQFVERNYQLAFKWPFKVFFSNLLKCRPGKADDQVAVELPDTLELKEKQLPNLGLEAISK